MQSTKLLDLKEQKEEKYIKISYSEAKQNKNYLNLFQNKFTEMAIIFTQRNWREKKIKENKEFKDKYTYTGKITKPSSNPISLRFIKESLSTKSAMDHADKIKQKKYTKLNFSDPEFLRNIFKACRIGLINSNQLKNAWFAYTMQEHFQGRELKQYTFEEKGPFTFTAINFVNEELSEKIKSEIAKLPEDDNFYFSINFPYLQTLYFLHLGLTQHINKSTPFQLRFFNAYPLYLSILKKYIQQTKILDSEKEKLYTHANKLILEESSDAAIEELLKFLRFQQEIPLEALLTTKKISNIQFLMQLLRIAEEIPSLEISPDYDPKQPDSPLICFNVLSIPVFDILQQHLFSADTIKPFFTVGEISTRFMRDLDENPSKYNAASSRPIEITHPDVENSKTYHSYLASPFLAAWHDLFHTWKCSLNVLKDLSRYLISIEQDETGNDMSKLIWYHVDKDFLFGAEIKRNMLLGDKKAANMAHGNGLVRVLGNPFWNETDKKDLFLLYCIDLMVHKNKWAELCSANLDEIVPKDDSYKSFHTAYDELSKIMTSEKTTLETFQSPMYYILAYRLKDYENGKKLLDAANAIGLNKLFYWTKDNGIYLGKKSDADGMAISKLTYGLPHEKIALLKKLELLVKPHEKVNILAKLNTGLDYVLKTCVLGANDKIEDIQKTKREICKLPYHYLTSGEYKKLSDYKPTTEDKNANQHTVYKHWFYRADKYDLYPVKISLLNYTTKMNPLSDKQFSLKEDLATLLAYSIIHINSKYAHDTGFCRLMAKYLWEHNSGIDRIEVIMLTTSQHPFVLVNRKGDDLQNSKSWGDAWCIDPWYEKRNDLKNPKHLVNTKRIKGIIFHANEFKDKIEEIKEYVKFQNQQLKKLELTDKTLEESKEEKLSQLHEIKPLEDKYPTYSSSRSCPIESYYYLEHAYPRGSLTKIDGFFSAKRTHAEKFKKSLDEIKKGAKLR